MFFAAFFPVHFLLKGQDKLRSKIEVIYFIWYIYVGFHSIFVYIIPQAAFEMCSWSNNLLLQFIDLSGYDLSFAIELQGLASSN